MWAVHLGRTYGTGQHRHKKWSVLQTVMARAGYDSTPHSQPAASGPPQQSSWSTLLSPTTRSYAEGLALGIPLPVNWILGEQVKIGESCYLTLVGLLWRLCVWNAAGLNYQHILEIGYKKPKDQKVDVHRKEQTGRRT